MAIIISKNNSDSNSRMNNIHSTNNFTTCNDNTTMMVANDHNEKPNVQMETTTMMSKITNKEIDSNTLLRFPSHDSMKNASAVAVTAEYILGSIEIVPESIENRKTSQTTTTTATTTTTTNSNAMDNYDIPKNLCKMMIMKIAKSENDDDDDDGEKQKQPQNVCVCNNFIINGKIVDKHLSLSQTTETEAAAAVTDNSIQFVSHHDDNDDLNGTKKKICSPLSSSSFNNSCRQNFHCCCCYYCCGDGSTTTIKAKNSVQQQSDSVYDGFLQKDQSNTHKQSQANYNK
ncbi:hypothetical protein DERP_008797 [Dermatophagoides pteronyssinus]|uniref:Uncharacterized protein n=1 Tax=Dermatophagoides pteronyssinus TaxID=6956 RepID=A0ABQ8IW95_DERPT|nr:hypothetical protein DERP_008797 [Dermatophagoides pteronyssinus]